MTRKKHKETNLFEKSVVLASIILGVLFYYLITIGYGLSLILFLCILATVLAFARKPKHILSIILGWTLIWTLTFLLGIIQNSWNLRTFAIALFLWGVPLILFVISFHVSLLYEKEGD